MACSLCSAPIEAQAGKMHRQDMVEKMKRCDVVVGTAEIILQACAAAWLRSEESYSYQCLFLVEGDATKHFSVKKRDFQ